MNDLVWLSTLIQFTEYLLSRPLLLLKSKRRVRGKSPGQNGNGRIRSEVPSLAFSPTIVTGVIVNHSWVIRTLDHYVTGNFIYISSVNIVTILREVGLHCWQIVFDSFNLLIRLGGGVSLCVVVVVVAIHSVTKSRPTLCHPMGCSTPGFPALHYLSEFACSNSCPLIRWGHPVISFSVAPSFSCPQSFPASGSFSMSWLSASGDQRIGALASASVLCMALCYLQISWQGVWSCYISLNQRTLTGNLIAKKKKKKKKNTFIFCVCVCVCVITFW